MRRLAWMILTVVCFFGAIVADAGLSKKYQFNGKGNWSLDAIGGNNTEGPIGVLRAVVPPGSTVVKAYLYCSRNYAGSSTKPTIVFDGTTYAPGDWTTLGTTAGLQAFRADVTTKVAAKIGSGSASTNTFSVDSEDLNTSTDGEVLAIVYSNPAEKERTIAFLDGFSATSGDSTTFTFASPLNITPGFEALMSLGIGFSYQPDGQISQVDINGRRLTSSAGGEDDGVADDGGLITVGGIGDDPANPADPFADDSSGTRADDELYDLAQGNATNATPFLVNGLTSFEVSTLNPSDDDNIFFLGLNVTAKGGVSGGGGGCSSANDLLTQVRALGLPRYRLLRLEREISIIGNSLTRRNYTAARGNCKVVARILRSLVRSGAISSVDADSISQCCGSLSNATPSSGGGGGSSGGDI